MKFNMLALAASWMLATGTAFAQQETPPACPAAGPDRPAELHRSWILEGWERAPGDPAFKFADKLGRYYDLDGEGVFYDDLAPEGITGAAELGGDIV